mgnify:CR=1 FL=1
MGGGGFDMSLNPLKQVWFLEKVVHGEIETRTFKSLNPLKQVWFLEMKKYCFNNYLEQVLIP